MADMQGLLYSFVDRVPFLRYHTLFNVKVDVGGVSLKVPIVSGEAPQAANYEPWLQTAIERIFSVRKGAFVDVGANRGQTLLKVAAVDRRRRYVGFEPNVSCATFVERIISLNNLQAHSVLPVGLSDQPGVLELFLSRTGSESNTTAISVRGAQAYAGSKHVVVAKGDEVLAGLSIGDIAVVKVDVEGAELEVFSGLRQTLQALRPWLIFEVLPPSLVDKVEARLESHDRVEVTANNQARARQLCQLLQGLGYRLWLIHTDATVQPADGFDLGADIALSNFIAAPAADESMLAGVFPLRRGRSAVSGF